MWQQENKIIHLYDELNNLAEVGTLQEETQEDHLAAVDGDQPVTPSEEEAEEEAAEEAAEEGETPILMPTMPLNKEEVSLEEKNQ